MPKWGLSNEQRALRPWSLPEDLLQPAKTTTDPVHSDIYLTELERLIVDSPPMQRLRRVRQLGTTHLVYQGATHSRFSHSLGTLRAAQDLLDAVADNAAGARPPEKHLLNEWSAATRPFHWAEATVLARLGALMHDICHVPFGHTIEDDLRVLEPHDENAKRFRLIWKDVNPRARKAIEDADPELLRDLRRLILSKEKRIPGAPKSRYPFVEDIVGNTICADLMDYLRRDHQATGLPMDVGVRFINDFYVSPSDHPLHPARMVIKIDRNGHVRRDVVDEITKYLRYRYEESERALFHHAKTAADAMIGKMLEMWADSLWIDGVVRVHPALALHRADRKDVLEKLLLLPNGSNIAKAAEKDVKLFLESVFTSTSDDGLLEMLAAKREAADSREKAVGTLAHAILNRKLFKPIGRAEGESALSNAETLHEEFGGASVRREKEIVAAEFSGVDPAWHIVLWLPKPSMRFKAADVLVDKRGYIAKLAKVLEGRDARRLVKKHETLWSVIVYAADDVRRDENRIDEVLSKLGAQMGLKFTTWTGRRVPDLEGLIADRLVHLDLIRLEDAPAVVALYRSTVAAKVGGGDFQRQCRETLDAARAAKIAIPGKRTPKKF